MSDERIALESVDGEWQCCPAGCKLHYFDGAPRVTTLRKAEREETGTVAPHIHVAAGCPVHGDGKPDLAAFREQVRRMATERPADWSRIIGALSDLPESAWAPDRMERAAAIANEATAAGAGREAAVREALDEAATAFAWMANDQRNNLPMDERRSIRDRLTRLAAALAASPAASQPAAAAWDEGTLMEAIQDAISVTFDDDLGTETERRLRDALAANLRYFAPPAQQQPGAQEGA